MERSVTLLRLNVYSTSERRSVYFGLSQVIRKEGLQMAFGMPELLIAVFALTGVLMTTVLVRRVRR